MRCILAVIWVTLWGNGLAVMCDYVPIFLGSKVRGSGGVYLIQQLIH